MKKKMSVAHQTEKMGEWIGRLGLDSRADCTQNAAENLIKLNIFSIILRQKENGSLALRSIKGKERPVRD